MLRVTLIAVGKLKESYLRDACAEYEKRLGRFCKLSIIEVDESRLPTSPTAAQVEKCLEAEGTAILSRLPKGALLAALCIEGSSLTSEGLAGELERCSALSSHVVFVVGGSHGLSPAVKQAADSSLSMSRMTFPHQLARVMLLEQIYRGFSILAGAKYHK